MKHDAIEKPNETSAMNQIALLELAANMRIAEAESLGIGFPSGSLYAIFQAFDCLSLIEAPKNAQRFDLDGENDFEVSDIEVTQDDCLDQTHVLLCISYAHATAVVAEAFVKKFNHLEEQTASIDIGKTKYASYEDVQSFTQTQQDYLNSLSEFNYSFIDSDDNNFRELFVEFSDMEWKDRYVLLDKIDAWRTAAEARYEARLKAQDIFDKALSERNVFVAKVNGIAYLISILVLAAGFVSHFIR